MGGMIDLHCHLRPELREGMLAAAEILGQEAAHALVYKRPLAIIGDSYVGPS